MSMIRKIYIFGAHSRAQTLAAYLQYLYPDIRVKAYLFDNEETNPDKIGEIPVLRLNGDMPKDTDCPVYICTRGVYHSQIIERLKQIGFEKIYPVTAELDRQFRNAYLKKYFISIGKKFPKIDSLEDETEKSAAVYVVRSIFDAPLRQPYRLASYEKEIQAGAALTEKRITKRMITDDIEDNISARNKQFCELTVLYWIWKNAREDIVGLAHYRRHFILPEDWVERMKKNAVDVILPVPLYVAPSVADNYKKRHDPADWDYMMKYLKRNHESEYSEAKDFFGKNLYSPCNMFIMRKEVLRELCEWLFPIVFEAAGYGGTKEDHYQNRYPGFLSERLISFYFERYSYRYKVAYADKNFLT
ncbi:MAG: DUF4422 domain-containing protein [Dorea sp.]|jgi:hypothetical protein|nr:DUF4422 domain-containing protein [Dorea sp.]